MSVIFMGMEMPKQGWKCPLNGGGVCKLESLSCGKYIPALCPLRPLPEKHGRLIDENWLKKAMITTLEALRKNPKMDGQEMHLIAAFDTLRAMIDDAPTIVEEEGR